MTTEKYSDAIKLTAEKFGLPDFAYQKQIVSNDEKEEAMNIIKDIKQNILLLCDRQAPGKNNIIIPFYEVIASSLPAEKAGDMTTAKRLFSLMSLSALINVDRRPRHHLAPRQLLGFVYDILMLWKECHGWKAALFAICAGDIIYQVSARLKIYFMPTAVFFQFLVTLLIKP